MCRKATITGLMTCVLLAPLAATVLVPATLQELSQEASVIVRGRVVAAEAVASGDWRTIETIVTLAVDEALKGTVSAAVQFRMPGGRIGRYRRVVVGAPELHAGQRLVVFLTNRGTDLPYAIGMGQGVFRLVERNGELLVTPAPAMRIGSGIRGSGRGDLSRRALPLGEFERQVRALAGSIR
jgi:hypothetical protein